MNLIVHQGDEWTDHERGSTPCQSWQLVAKGLARPCRHHEQCIFARRDLSADGLLVGPERGEAESLLEKLGEGCEAWYPFSDRGIGRLRILGCASDRRSLSGRCLSNLRDYRANILTDAIEKRFQSGLAMLNRFEKCFPLAGHRRTLHLEIGR